MTALTYCTNVHPGERWADVREHLAVEVPRVQRELGVSGPFPVGLRLSAEAARSLAAGPARAELSGLLDAHRLVVPTLNGFPYGAFHGGRVKERVFLPDWRERARLEYTNALAEILAAVLPEETTGSISTLPGADRDAAAPPAIAAITANLLEHAALLVALERDRGVRLCLGLEPEPFALLETTDEAVSFFEAHLFSREAVAAFAARTELTRPRAEAALRRHLGLCLDACHMAVLFEDPRESLERVRAAGVAIAKIQVSAALEVDFAAHGEEAARALARFADDVYLHQVVSDDGARYRDLDVALAARSARDRSRWRVHFHVPVFVDAIPPFRSTQRELVALLARTPRDVLHEVETYTFAVLPPELREPTLARSVARELAWTERCLRA